jgi:hypothetical protein
LKFSEPAKVRFTLALGKAITMPGATGAIDQIASPRRIAATSSSLSGGPTISMPAC